VSAQSLKLERLFSLKRLVVTSLIVAALVFGFWFLVCYAATQIATQLRQRCIQEVCSNKEAWKRLNESNGTPAMDLGPMKLY